MNILPLVNKIKEYDNKVTHKRVQCIMYLLNLKLMAGNDRLRIDYYKRGYPFSPQVKEAYYSTSISMPPTYYVEMVLMSMLTRAQEMSDDELCELACSSPSFYSARNEISKASIKKESFLKKHLL